MVDPDRLSAAYETARCDLLAETAAAGHWIGELSCSPLATATAISALALAERHAPMIAGHFVDENRECRLSELIMASVHWLADHQNSDGGWGDTETSLSNISATMLVRAAFALTAVPADNPGLLERADAYIQSQGGLRGLRRYHRRDKSFADAVLTNCALAGLIPWRKVPALRFAWACLPRPAWKFLRLTVAGYAIPALVAVGQSRFFHQRPWNPITRLLGHLTCDKSLEVLETLQPPSGGFFESTPLTSFVVMNLAGIGRADHPSVRRGVEFLLNGVRPNGSWTIGRDLAVRNTSLAVAALASAGENVRALRCLDWLLASQRRVFNPDTGMETGGWSWTDAAGGVPETHDTSAALLALAAWAKASVADQHRIQAAALCGVRWLLDLQNPDGGWPTFCRCRGRLPSDRSGSELTANALRALTAWRAMLAHEASPTEESQAALDRRIGMAIERGLRRLIAMQHPDGYWEPLWFGNQHRADQKNPIHGTATVLAAFRDLNRLNTAPADRALEWLMTMKHGDGSWGGNVGTDSDAVGRQASVEETALATEALLTCGQIKSHDVAANRGLEWLIEAVQANRHQESAPIGLFFSKLWYSERLYPIIATVAALGRADRGTRATPEATSIGDLGKLRRAVEK